MVIYILFLPYCQDKMSIFTSCDLRRLVLSVTCQEDRDQHLLQLLTCSKITGPVSRQSCGFCFSLFCAWSNEVIICIFLVIFTWRSQSKTCKYGQSTLLPPHLRVFSSILQPQGFRLLTVAHPLANLSSPH